MVYFDEARGTYLCNWGEADDSTTPLFSRQSIGHSYQVGTLYRTYVFILVYTPRGSRGHGTEFPFIYK